MKHIVFNAIVCMNCGRMIESSHVHDYKECGCENRSMVDGGLDYQRYGGMDMNLVHSIVIWDDQPFEEVRKYAFRRHLTGEIVRLYKMSNEWLVNAYLWEKDHGRDTWHTRLLGKEITYRDEKKIFIKEDTILKEKAERIMQEAKERASQADTQEGGIRLVPPVVEREGSKERNKWNLPWKGRS